MSSAVWSELAALAKAPLNLRQEFAEDPQRAQRFTAKALGITLDYSKNLITQAFGSNCSSWPRKVHYRPNAPRCLPATN